MALTAARQPPRHVASIMRSVLLALVPGTALHVWWFGWGVIVQICIAVLTALLCEAALCRLRSRAVGETLADSSAIVTAFLLALCIPSLAPWWLIVLGTAFAIVVAKHLYGGLGGNIFNPAMVGYAVLIISYPAHMTQWPGTPAASLDLATVLAIIGDGIPAPDGVTGATALDQLRTQLLLGRGLDAIRSEFEFGRFGSLGWEWVAAGYALGGIWMLWRGIIRWQIPAATLGSLLLLALMFHLIDPQRFASPLFHLVAGAGVLGAFFIATDPVTAAASPGGRVIFGIGTGSLIYVIRTWGGYPDGVAFAVLVMNMAAPAIDYFTTPNVPATEDDEV